MKVLFISNILAICIICSFASKIHNDDKEQEEISTDSPQMDKLENAKNHPALNPGFPYIWPYLPTPYFNPYFWPAYLYHGQYTPHIAKSQTDNLKNSKRSPYMEQLVFIGKFAGTCKAYPNGLYYINNKSFAYCSNGIKTVQNCPEGAENPRLSEFYKGLYRFVHDFCSVNLLVNKVPINPQAFLRRLTDKNGQ